MRGAKSRYESIQTQTGFIYEPLTKRTAMKRTTVNVLLTTILAVPSTMIGAVPLDLPLLHEFRKLVNVNRVDRVSTNADWIRIEGSMRDLPAPATLAPALTPIDVPAPANDFSPPASEPAAIASSSRVELRRPTLDPRSVGKRNRLG